MDHSLPQTWPQAGPLASLVLGFLSWRWRQSCLISLSWELDYVKRVWPGCGSTEQSLSIVPIHVYLLIQEFIQLLLCAPNGKGYQENKKQRCFHGAYSLFRDINVPIAKDKPAPVVGATDEMVLWAPATMQRGWDSGQALWPAGVSLTSSTTTNQADNLEQVGVLTLCFGLLICKTGVTVAYLRHRVVMKIK